MIRRFATALTLALIVAAPAARAQDLPKAEEILDKYVEATGGKAAYEKLKSRITKGTMKMPAANIEGKVTIYQADPANMVTKIDLGQFGTTSQAVVDGLAWEQSPITGDRVMEGGQKEAALRTARFNAEVEWREIYPKAEAVGTEDIDGKPAYKVVLTPKTGPATTNYYDKASGLLVRSDATIETPMGNIPVKTSLSDYKKVDGIMIPFKTKQDVVSQSIEIAIDEVKHNVDLPKDVFAVPAEIKALASKKSK